MITLFVSNVGFQADDSDLSSFFVEGGYWPDRCRIAKDGGKSRGFAFVEFADRQAGLECIADMDGQDFMGRRINVREATDSKAKAVGGRK